MILPTQGLTLSYESAVSAALFLPLVAGVDSSMDRNHSRGAEGYPEEFADAGIH